MKSKNTEAQVHPQVLGRGVGILILKSSPRECHCAAGDENNSAKAPSTQQCPRHPKFLHPGAETGSSTPFSHPPTQVHTHSLE